MKTDQPDAPPPAAGQFAPLGRAAPFVAALHEILRGLGWTALVLYAATFTTFIVRHASQIRDREILALQRLSSVFESRAPAETPRGYEGGTVISYIPEEVLIIISILAAVYMVIWSISWVPRIIQKWVTVFRCGWTQSFLSFLGCLWQLFLVLVETLVYILLMIATVILAVANILALIAIFV